VWRARCIGAAGTVKAVKACAGLLKKATRDLRHDHVVRVPSVCAEARGVGGETLGMRLVLRLAARGSNMELLLKPAAHAEQRRRSGGGRAA